jgi:hypothetical protein
VHTQRQEQASSHLNGEIFQFEREEVRSCGSTRSSGRTATRNRGSVGRTARRAGGHVGRGKARGDGTGTSSGESEERNFSEKIQEITRKQRGSKGRNSNRTEHGYFQIPECGRKLREIRFRVNFDLRFCAIFCRVVGVFRASFSRSFFFLVTRDFLVASEDSETREIPKNRVTPPNRLFLQAPLHDGCSSSQ